MTSAMMPTPSTRTAASSMFVWILPAASGWRAMPSTALDADAAQAEADAEDREARADARADVRAELHDCGSQGCKVHSRSPHPSVSVYAADVPYGDREDCRTHAPCFLMASPMNSAERKEKM